MPLQDCIELTRIIDRQCFPEEMWLTPPEWERLLEGGAEATILRKDGEIIGQAITLPETYVEASLLEVDADFTADSNGIYSYSEAILPEYQFKGYGKLLIEEIAIRMRNRGYTRITAHVRTRYGWHERRRKHLKVTDHRPVSDFWEDPADQVVEFQHSPLSSFAS